MAPLEAPRLPGAATAPAGRERKLAGKARGPLVARTCGLGLGFRRRRARRGYDWSRSTQANHTLQGDRSTGGRSPSRFASIRETLDLDYHGHYSASRTRLQDEIISDFVGGGVVSEHPWIIFTAGAMGAGKGHTMKWMGEQGHFPIDKLVHIDPDVFRARLPEWPMYMLRDPETAGQLTQRESGYCVEIAQEAALQQSKSMWIDGSLHDSDWYSQVFAKIRRNHPQYRIAIIHVYAPWDAVVSRAADRARATGRLVPQAALRESFSRVPQAVERLSGLADVTAHVENADVPRLVRVVCGCGPQPARPGPPWRRPTLLRASREASGLELEFCFCQAPRGGGFDPDVVRDFLGGFSLLRRFVPFSSSCCEVCGRTRELLEAEAGG